jgi:DNA-binding PadR family transcriptional regulator
MKRQTIPLLGYALMGLLQQKPSSGYDLRKIFAHTPMGTFSDSPGAIYPALHRLEEQGLIGGHVEARGALRKRKVFRLKSTGAEELTRWLAQPVTRADVIRGRRGLMLRFAFSEGAAGAEAAIRLLRSLQTELQAYIPFLREHLKSQQEKMPFSGRLALEGGVMEYEAQLQWTRNALVAYERKKRAEKS